MKKFNKKWLFALVTAISTVVAATSKNNKVKAAASAVSLGCSLPILLSFTKKTVKEVNKECDETEKIINDLGLDVNSMDSDLIDSEAVKAVSALEGLEKDVKNGTPLYSLYLQARKVFDDEMLDYHPTESFESGTIHVMQRDNTLILGMRLPGNERGDGPSDIDIYQYFNKGEFKEEVLDKLECAGIYVYRKGIVHYNEKPFEKFDVIEREEGEPVHNYYRRISQIVESWDKFDGFRQDMKAEFEKKGKDLRGYYNFLFIELPIKTSNSIVPGMTITKTLKLLRRMTEEGANVISRYGSLDETFELDRILIHPGDDLSRVFTVAIQDDENDQEVKVITTVDI